MEKARRNGGLENQPLDKAARRKAGWCRPTPAEIMNANQGPLQAPGAARSNTIGMSKYAHCATKTTYLNYPIQEAHSLADPNLRRLELAHNDVHHPPLEVRVEVVLPCSRPLTRMTF